MSELEPEKPEEIVCKDEVRLTLRRIRNPGAVPVLLLHGASARHESFLIPCADEGEAPRSLAGWLHHQGFEPWLLDWRASSSVVENTADPHALRELFDLDHAAREDVPRALEKIREEHPSGPIAAIGHCMGAGVLAQSIAAGHLEEYGLTHVVLLTLGLFYEPPLDSRLKTQDRLLDRLLDRRCEVVEIHPKRLDRWPSELSRIYQGWPRSLRPHPGQKLSPAEQLCDTLSFMYGSIYYEPNLVPEIHGDGNGAGGVLPEHFGPIALRMYAQAARNARRGWAADFEPRDERHLLGPRERARFDRLRRVTLITGQRNQLWHRNSIDRMYEWLTRGRSGPVEVVRKHVLPGYGHQDLLWGCKAREQVFQAFILPALRPPVALPAAIRRRAGVRRRRAPIIQPELRE